MKNIIIDNISTLYFITEDGKCYNSKTGKYLKGQKNYKNHYLSYNLTLPDGSKRRMYAHRLVALAYIPNKEKRKNQVNHIDGNKMNNCVDNLEWVTNQENINHSQELELRKVEHVFCFNKQKQLIAEYKNLKEASKAVGISWSIIQQELHKEVKALSGGFFWSTASDNSFSTIEYKNLGKAKIVNQYDKNGKFINQYESTGVAARAIGVRNSSHIGECCRGKIKTYKGFIWRYAEDIVSPSSES